MKAAKAGAAPDDVIDVVGGQPHAFQLPRMEKMTTPAMIEVRNPGKEMTVSRSECTLAELVVASEHDEGPQEHIDRKNICSAAFCLCPGQRYSFGPVQLCGTKKSLIPVPGPFQVHPTTRRMSKR